MIQVLIIRWMFDTSIMYVRRHALGAALRLRRILEFFQQEATDGMYLADLKINLQSPCDTVKYRIFCYKKDIITNNAIYEAIHVPLSTINLSKIIGSSTTGSWQRSAATIGRLCNIVYGSSSSTLMYMISTSLDTRK